MIPLQYKLMGYGLAALAVAFLAWKVIGWRNDSLAYGVMKPAYEGLVENQRKANAEVERVRPIDEAARTQLELDRAKLAAEQGQLTVAWNKVRAVQEKPDETGHVVVRLSDAWGVCFSAAATADAADLAACQAAGSDGTVAASPGS